MLVAVTSLTGQTSDESFTRSLNNINQSALKAQLGFLASDWTEGREAGKKGEYLAAEYIASILQLYGVKPGGDISGEEFPQWQPGNRKETYFQNFVLIKTSPGEEQIMKVRTSDGKSSKNHKLDEEYRFSVGYPDQEY